MSHTWRNPILEVNAFHRNDPTIRKIIPPDSQELSQVEVVIVYSGTMLHWIIFGLTGVIVYKARVGLCTSNPLKARQSKYSSKCVYWDHNKHIKY